MKIVLKVILISIFLLCIIPNTVNSTEDLIESQYEALDLSSLVTAGNKYTKENFPDIDINSLLNDAIKGKVDKKGLTKNIISLSIQEIKQAVIIMCSILIIVIIHSILKSIVDGLENSHSGQIAYYVEYVLIVTIVLANFSGIVSSVNESINNMVAYMNILVPLLLSLIATTGSIASASFLQPVILFSVVLVGNIVNILILPISLVATVLGIISNISDKVQISKLSNMIKKTTIWVFGFIVTIFISILSLEGSLTSSIDGITMKSLQTATSSFVPVVGKSLKESVSVILGAISVIKNAVGIVGIIIVIGICAMPIIKLSILSLIYNFSAAVCEPIADKKIVKVIEQMAGTYQLLLGILFFIAVLFIIGIAMMLKISNVGLMYQ